jgi:hypothetical protein
MEEVENMKMKNSILLRVSIVLLGFSVISGIMSLLLYFRLLLPVPNPWRSTLIAGIIGTILIIISVLQNIRSEHSGPGNAGSQNSLRRADGKNSPSDRRGEVRFVASA